MSLKVICLFAAAFLLCVIKNEAKPTEEENAALVTEDEITETAESHSFLPRFAMKRLKERREQARAQRRNYRGQSWQGQYDGRVRC